MMEDEVSGEYIRAYRSNQIFNINRAIGRYMQLEDMAKAALEQVRNARGTGSLAIPTTVRVYLEYCGFYEDTETDELEYTLGERSNFDEDREVDLFIDLLEKAKLNCFYKQRELNVILERNIRSGATVKASTMDRYVDGD